MGILSFIIFGFIVGLLARALMPGDQRMGILMTTGLGLAGSFVGGFLTSLFTHRPWMEFQMVGIIGSVIGALVLLFVGSVASRRG